MKIMILGEGGVSSVIIASYFKDNPNYDVLYVTTNQNDKSSLYLDVTNFIKVEEIIDNIKPDIIINCVGMSNVGIINDTLKDFQVYSLLPHQLAKLSERYQGRLIHISTEKIVLGQKGSDIEENVQKGSSPYTQFKQLGEVYNGNHLTIRTAVLDPNLNIIKEKRCFLEGVTPLELAEAINQIIQLELFGLYNLKFDKKKSSFKLLNLMECTSETSEPKVPCTPLSCREIILNKKNGCEINE